MDRVITEEELIEDSFEKNIRPESLQEYVGQSEVKENLGIFIKAAKLREEPLDHTLLYGPPGLGKTTLSNIIANEMNANIRITSGPAIEKQGDLAALLTNLNSGSSNNVSSNENIKLSANLYIIIGKPVSSFSSLIFSNFIVS